MKKTIINNLFSTPVYSTAINRNFTKKEIDFVRDQKNYCSNNAGNTHTIDSYILNIVNYLLFSMNHQIGDKQYHMLFFARLRW